MKEHPSSKDDTVPTRTKNPLHPSALSINSLTVGRRVILFNVHFGIDEEGTIVSRPYVKFNPEMAYVWPHGQLAVDIRSKSSGAVRAHFLDQIGVADYLAFYPRRKFSWSLVNFTVDHRKRHLLPEPLGLPRGYIDQLGVDLELEEMAMGYFEE